MTKPIYGIGVDPGGVNIAIAVVKARQISGRTQVKVVKCGVFKNYISNLAADDATELGSAFMEELERKVRAFPKPSFIICERFQSRGNRFGNVSEQANIVVGLIIAWASLHKIRVRLITAATWKNRVNSVFNLKQTYKEVRTTPHELDASLMGVFGCYSEFNAVPPYKEFKSSVSKNKLLDSIENNSTGKLRNIRVKRKGARS